MHEQKAENYNLEVTIETESAQIHNVHCKVYLPKKSNDPIVLRLFLTKTQWEELKPIAVFSIKGEEKGKFLVGFAKIQADEAYVKNVYPDYRGYKVKEIILSAEAKNLLVIERLRPKESGDIGNSVGCFWLTPGGPFYPWKFPKLLESNKIEFETKHQITFTSPKGINLTFNTQNHSSRNEEGDEVISTRLVAEFELEELESPVSKINETLEHLNDFLLIGSFAERKRCMCVGWEFQNKATHTLYYRRGIAIPIKEKEERISPLLPLKFDQFIKTAYEKFNELEPKDHLRRAINYVLPVPQEKRTIESSFIILYAALEQFSVAFSL